MENTSKKEQKRTENIKLHIEKYAALKAALKSHYDSVDIKGGILVDGHHVFLNVARSIKRLNENPENFLKRIGIPNPQKAYQLVEGSKWAEFSADRIASIYGQIVLHISDEAQNHILKNVLGDSRSLVQQHTLTSLARNQSEDQLENIIARKLEEYPPDNFVCASTDAERWAFDATMPNIEGVEKNLFLNYQYWITKNKNRAQNIGDYLELLKNQDWAFFESQVRGSIVMPYSVKNDVLEKLTEDWFLGDFKVTTQERQISGFNGYVESREKGVDTKFVIKGCEYASSTEIDWVWLVTADGDHAPLVEHLISSGKEVFVTSLSQPSNALLKALKSPTNYLHFDTLLKHDDQWRALNKEHLLDYSSGAGIDFQVFSGCVQDYLVEGLPIEELF